MEYKPKHSTKLGKSVQPLSRILLKILSDDIEIYNRCVELVRDFSIAIQNLDEGSDFKNFSFAVVPKFSTPQNSVAKIRFYRRRTERMLKVLKRVVPNKSFVEDMLKQQFKLKRSEIDVVGNVYM